MLVEFAGPPGSGKTALAEATERDLAEHGVRCRSVVARVPAGGVSKLGGLVAALRSDLGRRAIAERGLPLRSHRLPLVPDLVRRIQAVSRLRLEGDEVVLIDEGPWHGLWSLTLDSRVDHERFLTLVRLLPVPDLLILVAATADTALDRLRRRGRHRLLSLPRDRAAQLLEAQAQRFQPVYDAWPQGALVVVDAVHGGGIAVSAERVGRAIRERLAERTS